MRSVTGPGQEVPAGTLLSVTGDFSDRAVVDVFRVLKPFSEDTVAALVHERLQVSTYQPTRAALERLVEDGYVEVVESSAVLELDASDRESPAYLCMLPRLDGSEPSGGTPVGPGNGLPGPTGD